MTFALRRVVRSASVLVFVATAAPISCRIATIARERQSTEDAAPDGGRFVQAGDIRIHVQETGPSTGPAVLLVHGTGAWSEIWRETLTALASAGVHAIAIDVPPFGFSGKPHGPAAYSPARQAERIVALLDALGLERVTIVGHSVGARPSVETALAAPRRVEALVLVDPALGFGAAGSMEFAPNSPSWPLRVLFGTPLVRNAAMAAVATNSWATRSLFKSFVAKKSAVTDARVAMLQRPLLVREITRAEGDWLYYLMVSTDTSRVSRSRTLSELKMPVSLIWGTADDVTPIWQAGALQQLIPQATLTQIDGVGHIPYIEDADAFNRVLIRTLGTSAPNAVQ